VGMSHLFTVRQQAESTQPSGSDGFQIRTDAGRDAHPRPPRAGTHGGPHGCAADAAALVSAIRQPYIVDDDVGKDHKGSCNAHLTAPTV